MPKNKPLRDFKKREEKRIKVFSNPCPPKDNIVAPDEKTIKSTVKGRFFSCLSIEIFGRV